MLRVVSFTALFMIALVLESTMVEPARASDEVKRPPAYPGEEAAIAAILAADCSDHGGTLRGLADDDGRITWVRLSGKGIDDAVVAKLARLQHLTMCSLYATSITDASLDVLATCPNLRNLSLDATAITDAGLAKLALLKNLESLGVTATHIGDDGIRNLGVLPQLKVLRLENTDVTDAGLAYLKQFPKLEELTLRRLIDLELQASRKVERPRTDRGPYLTDEGCAALSQLQQLRSLDLAGCRISDAGLRHLARLTKLTKLDLEQTLVTDAGLAHLASLTELTDLTLNHLPITDSGLVHLRGMKKLMRLYLSHTAITTAGLEQVSALPELLHVDTANTHVGRKGRLAHYKLRQLNTMRFLIENRYGEHKQVAAGAAEAALEKLAKGDAEPFLLYLDEHPEAISLGLGRYTDDDEDGTMYHDVTALHLAVVHDDLAMARRLLTRGASARTPDGSQRTPLTYARSMAMAELLLEYDAELEPHMKETDSPLFHAPNVELAKLYLDRGAKVGRLGVDGRTALHEAIHRGRTDVVRLLIERGADLNAYFPYPYPNAEPKGQNQVVEHRTALQGRIHKTPLAVAAASNRLEIAQLLLQHGARCEVEREEEATALEFAVQYGSPQLVRLLLKSGARLERTKRRSGTLLAWAVALHRDLEVARMLIDAGAPINAKLPADVPVRFNDPFGSVVDLSTLPPRLIEFTTDFRDWTPLHYAAYEGNEAGVQWLLEHGADVFARSPAGWTPLEAADRVEQVESRTSYFNYSPPPTGAVRRPAATSSKTSSSETQGPGTQNDSEETTTTGAEEAANATPAELEVQRRNEARVRIRELLKTVQAKTPAQR